MDANGNKVQALRQQFENYEKLEPGLATGKYSSLLKTSPSSSVGVAMGRSSELRPILASNNNKTQNILGHSNSVEDTRRNGIYVSNSISLHPDLQPSKSHSDLLASVAASSHKRRPMVLDLHHCGSDNYMMDEENSSILLGKGGDELSITSSSSSTCVNLLNASNCNEGEGEPKESESQAHTPTSSSSASSGSGYGKVKRSNAFRAKDVVAVNANDARFVNKSKLVLERVKSLDASSSSGATSGSPRGDSNGNIESNQNDPISNGGSPAQRAASVCVRPTQQKSSQMYDTKVSTRQTSSGTNTGKAVNIVTPYQVSDIYSQIRKGSYPSRKPQEVEYAIPIIRNHRHSTQSVSPPKIPPPPLNYPPSATAKDQIGLPGPGDSTYSYLQRRQSPYGEENPHSNSSQKGQGNDQVMRSSTGTNPNNPVAVHSTPSRGLPPEKPPRTFLYDILTDRQIQAQRNARNANSQELYGETPKKSSPQKTPPPPPPAHGGSGNTGNGNNQSNPKRQYSSSSSSSTLTSSTTSYKQPQSVRGSISVSTATVRQTNKSSNNVLNRNQMNSTTTTTSPIKGGNSKNALISSANNNKVDGNNANVSDRGAASMVSSNHHPPLVRSKTESQLIVKNKSNWHRPSMVGLDISNSNDNNNDSNYDYGYKTPTNNASFAGTPCSNYYASSTSHHHLSQNLLNNQRMYEALPQYRSTNNLLKYNNRYPSNPGIYQSASAGWKDHDHGLPPANNMNLRYTHVHPNHNHHHLHNHSHDLRSNSLMYMTDIDLEMDVSMTKGLNGLKVQDKSEGSNNHHNHNSSLSVFGSNIVNVNRCSSDDRLCERSKSEWALNHVHSNTNSSSVNPNSGHNLMIVGGSNNNNLRRNTVANTGGGNSTGHPSLDSSGSSNVSTGQHNNSNNNPKRHGIQQSIQNLVNQLFSASTTIGKDATSSTDSGIQLGSESLSSCDTPIGDSTTDTGDSDCENDGETSNSARQVVEARKGYVRRVSSIRVQELGVSINRLIQNSKKAHSTEPLFECLLVVGLNRDPYTGVYHAYIRDKFPPNAKLPAGVEQFCFPDSQEWPCHEGVSAQFYTLAITDQRGSRKYGCCFRILPEGANICIPITYCVISSHRAIGFYREVLREITLRHGYSEYQKRFWMEELYKKQFPSTGGSISITEPSVEELYQSPHHHQSLGHDPNVMTNCYNNFTVSPPKTVSIKRRADHRLDEGDLVTLLTTIDIATVIKIFGSLLLERKVVLISRALSTLSLCVEALESMLYPFSWQHTFVPILPLSMTDVLDAPAPFLIGVLRSSQTAWDKTLDEGVVVDLDQNKIISCVGDEGTILPKRIHRKLRDALQLVLNLADQKESTKNVLISECFIRMFVETMGHHANHIVVQQDGLKIFERESFVKSCDSKAVQNFLEWFSETSMFHEFTQLRLKNTHQHGLFEQRVIEQLEQNQSHHNGGSGTPLSFKNAKLFMNKTRPFGNWLKEAFVK